MERRLECAAQVMSLHTNFATRKEGCLPEVFAFPRCVEDEHTVNNSSEQGTLLEPALKLYTNPQPLLVPQTPNPANPLSSKFWETRGGLGLRIVNDLW